MLTFASKMPNWSLGLSSTFREVKECYKTCAEAFLQNQKQAIFDSIQSYANDNECQNLIALSIIKLLKEEYPVCKKNKDSLSSLLKEMSIDDLDRYLSHGEIIAIPASITASVNLVIIITCGLMALDINPELKHALATELKDAGVDRAILENDIQSLKRFFEHNEKQNGLLHRTYLESLRRENLLKTSDHLAIETIQTRYTSKPIPIGDHGVIPAKSTIMFLPGTVRFDPSLWDDLELFDPTRYEKNASLSKYPASIFFEGPRQCPAKSISSHLFKSIVSYLTLFCDLKLEYGKDKHSDKIGIEYSPIMLEGNLESSHSCKSK